MCTVHKTGLYLLLPDDRVHVQGGLVTDNHIPVGHCLPPGSTSADHGPDCDAPNAAVIIIIISIIIIIIIIITDLSLSLLCR